MSKNFSSINDDVVSGAGSLANAIPEAMAGFAQLGAGTYVEGALTVKTKELIALAIGVAGRCDGCVAYHANAALKANASREEVSEAIAVAIHMGGGPSMVYGGEALRAYDEFVSKAS